jgi:hypothetical protein
MKATGKLAKTDRIDAQILARFAGAVDPKPSVIPGEEARPLQAILALRCQLSGLLVAAKNRHIMIPSRWPSASAPTRGGRRRRSLAPTGGSTRR